MELFQLNCITKYIKVDGFFVLKLAQLNDCFLFLVKIVSFLQNIWMWILSVWILSWCTCCHGICFLSESDWEWCYAAGAGSNKYSRFTMARTLRNSQIHHFKMHVSWPIRPSGILIGIRDCMLVSTTLLQILQMRFAILRFESNAAVDDEQCSVILFLLFLLSFSLLFCAVRYDQSEYRF